MTVPSCTRSGADPSVRFALTNPADFATRRTGPPSDSSLANADASVDDEGDPDDRRDPAGKGI